MPTGIHTQYSLVGRFTTIEQWQAGVKFRDGVFVSVLASGHHWLAPRTRVHIVDLRPSRITLHPQEILTADGVSVKATAFAVVSVNDPFAWVTASPDPQADIYAVVQLVLRERVASRTLSEVLKERSTLCDGAEDEIRVSLLNLGATLVEVGIRDITLSADIRARLAEIALVGHQARAELEKARAEAATLRSLINSAKLAAEHPHLLELRLLQAAASGAQIVYHAGSPATAQATE